MEADEAMETTRIDPVIAVVHADGNERERLVADLYRLHVDRLTRIAASITLNRALADELVHDAFEGLQRKLDVVDDPVAYLQRSVINLSLNVLRRRRTVRRHPPPPIASTVNPEVDETWVVVCELPPRQRAVVALRYWHDMSESEIARVLD